MNQTALQNCDGQGALQPGRGAGISRAIGPSGNRIARACPSSAIKVLHFVRPDLRGQNVPISGEPEGGIASSPATSVYGDMLPGFNLICG